MKNRFVKEYLGWVIVLAVAAALPLILTTNYYYQLFTQILIYTIATVGMTIIFGWSGQMNLGSIGIVGIGCYSAALLAQHLGVSDWRALLLGIAAGPVIGICLGFPALRVKGVYLVITTLSFATIVYSLMNNAVGLTGGPAGVYVEPLKILGISFSNKRAYYYFCLAVTALVILFVKRLNKYKFGRTMRAVRDNPDAAEALGVNTVRMNILAFVLSATCCTISGVLYLYMSRMAAPKLFTTGQGTQYLLMLIIGSIGSIPGAVIGATVITVLPEILQSIGIFGTNYKLVYYLILFTIVMVYPWGLFNLGKAAVAKVRDALHRKGEK